MPSSAADNGQDAAEVRLLAGLLAVKTLVAVGRKRGYLTYDELNAALPQDQVSSEQIEDTMTFLSELGIRRSSSMKPMADQLGRYPVVGMSRIRSCVGI